LYKTVVIGNKTWMAENLRYNDGSIACYGACDEHGVLYNWEKAKNSCPKGWHIATNSDWEDLVKIAGGESVAGKKLKARRGWGNNDNGTDDYGFSALPAGFVHSGTPNNLGIGFWWGRIVNYEKTDNEKPYQWKMSAGSKVENTEWRADTPETYFSVRCVKD
jgi:uncharacterized protein (TIGR02145 family)